MKRKISIILCLALIISLVPPTAVFAAKKIKAKSVSVAPKSMTLAVGDVAQINATKKPTNSTDKLTWSSSDASVATVSSKGVVQGVSAGTATITVKTTSKKTASCKVTVKDFATKDDLKSLMDELQLLKDELQKISQNTYTKDEIDALLAESSGEGSEGTNLTCLNESYFPMTTTLKRIVNGETYDISLTIKSMSCKKYAVMDYQTNEYGGESFVPYRYDFTVDYSLEGYEEYKQAVGDGDCYVPIIVYGLIGAQYTSDYTLDTNAQTVSFTLISPMDHNAFYYDGAGMDV